MNQSYITTFIQANTELDKVVHDRIVLETIEKESNNDRKELRQEIVDAFDRR